MSHLAAEKRISGRDRNVIPTVNPNLEKIERLLDEAQQLPPDQRAAFLDAACEGDETVRREVEALLAADAAAGTFLSANPKADLPAGTLNSPGTSLEGPGAVIGRYKLLEQIGEGGFGVVYLRMPGATSLDRFTSRGTIRWAWA